MLWSFRDAIRIAIRLSATILGVTTASSLFFALPAIAEQQTTSRNEAKPSTEAELTEEEKALMAKWLVAKLNALSTEIETGIDSFAGYHKMGIDTDCRDYALEVKILKSKGIQSIRLLTNNPHKITKVEGQGISVERNPLTVSVTETNRSYFEAQQQAGYLLA